MLGLFSIFFFFLLFYFILQTYQLTNDENGPHDPNVHRYHWPAGSVAFANFSFDWWDCNRSTIDLDQVKAH